MSVFNSRKAEQVKKQELRPKSLETDFTVGSAHDLLFKHKPLYLGQKSLSLWGLYSSWVWERMDNKSKKIK